jgi:hypothetical protein
MMNLIASVSNTLKFRWAIFQGSTTSVDAMESRKAVKEVALELTEPSDWPHI